MCGIAGFISPGRDPETRRLAVERMCAAMRHRGPDDAGLETSGPATVGMRRLAVFDPEHGHQPMATADGRHRIVFNGAIYNFPELKAELEGKGLSFRTHCDTEVLLNAYAEWGEDCLPRLRGMFAFAIWDEARRSLFLARDPFGIKPLHFREQSDGSLLFASELNALLASGECPGEIDPTALSDYLAWLAVPAPRTIYRGIRSLRPGECARWQDGRLEVRRYWHFSDLATGDQPCPDRPQFLQELRARLEDSMRAHVAADVPVGAFLSGGIDSAVVAGLMTQVGSGRLRTFSIGFGESAYSEAESAAATAHHFGAEHDASVLTGARVAEDLEFILRSQDQPSGDGINTFYASQAARAGGVTVALSGLGGDELFGGYPSFRDLPRLARWLRWWQAIPPAGRGPILRQLRAGDTRRRKLADFLQYARDAADLPALQRRVFDTTAQRSLLSPDAVPTSSPLHPEASELRRDLAGSDSFDAISAWELRTYMADVLLRDSDVMSMRHSLELRVPLVDVPLTAWLWRQPSAFKSDPRQPKSVLHEALRDLLPPDLATRRKQGFTLPFALWMKRELRPFLEETFSPASVGRSGLFSGDAALGLWRGYLQRDDPREWSRIWSLAVAIAFANRASGAPKSTRTAPAQIAAIRPLAGSSLLLAPEIFSSEGGIPRILQTYLCALAELAPPGEPVRLLALNDRTLDPADLGRGAAGREVTATACDRSKTRFVREAIRMSRGCRRLICGHVAQLPVAWAARRLHPSLRYYLVAHGIEVWRDLSPLERQALRGAERIFCVSDFTRQELLRRCPLPDGRAVVLPNALDRLISIRPGRPRNECPPVILTVSRLSRADRYKGVLDLIEALPAIRHEIPDATLRVVGRGDDLSFLRESATRLNLGSAVSFLGFLDDKALEAEMESCRLFALPSTREGFGLVFLEAMARGRPCLGVRAGGVPEVITPETGILADPGDPAGLARAAVAALREEWIEEALLERARTFSYPHFREALARLLAR